MEAEKHIDFQAGRSTINHIFTLIQVTEKKVLRNYYKEQLMHVKHIGFMCQRD